jgi:hypothetical protein
VVKVVVPVQNLYLKWDLPLLFLSFNNLFYPFFYNPYRDYRFIKLLVVFTDSTVFTLKTGKEMG